MPDAMLGCCLQYCLRYEVRRTSKPVCSATALHLLLILKVSHENQAVTLQYSNLTPLLT